MIVIYFKPFSFLKIPVLHMFATICLPTNKYIEGYYRAMHFSAKRGIAIACRLSLCPSVTLVNCDHI